MAIVPEHHDRNENRDRPPCTGKMHVGGVDGVRTGMHVHHSMEERMGVNWREEKTRGHINAVRERGDPREIVTVQEELIAEWQRRGAVARRQRRRWYALLES